MAIDTTEKKFSLLNYGLPWPATLPEADGSLDEGDKVHLLNLYSGIEIAVAVSATEGWVLEHQANDFALADQENTWELDHSSGGWTVYD